MTKVITAEIVKAKFIKDLATAKEKLASVKRKHNRFETEHERERQLQRETETLTKKQDALFKAERYKGNWETRNNRDNQKLPERLVPLLSQFKFEILREALEGFWQKENEKIRDSKEYGALYKQIRDAERRENHCFSTAHRQLDSRLYHFEDKVREAKENVESTKEKMWFARYCKNSGTGYESAMERAEQRETAQEKRRKEQIGVCLLAIKEAQKTPVLRCSCGAVASYICECGCLCCGSDPCEFGCGGAVLPLKEGIRRGIKPRQDINNNGGQQND